MTDEDRRDEDADPAERPLRSLVALLEHAARQHSEREAKGADPGEPPSGPSIRAHGCEFGVTFVPDAGETTDHEEGTKE